MLYAFLY